MAETDEKLELDRNDMEAVSSQDNYQYGFQDEDTSVYNTGKGLTEEKVREISRIKGEPE